MAFEAGVVVATPVMPKDLQIGLPLRNAKMYPEIDLCSDANVKESLVRTLCAFSNCASCWVFQLDCPLLSLRHFSGCSASV